MAVLDKESVRQAYETVRDDKNDTNWVVLKYEGNQIVPVGTGVDFEEFRSHFTDGERVFGYIRMCTGDEMSKRSKFALVTWIGNDINPLKRARISVDKATVKEVISSFAVEIATSDLDELTEENIVEKLKKAGGANYGTGQ